MKKQPECTEHVKHKEEKHEDREQPAHEQIPRWEHTRRLSSDDETSADAHNDEIKNARDDGHVFYSNARSGRVGSRPISSLIRSSEVSGRLDSSAERAATWDCVQKQNTGKFSPFERSLIATA
jgi:hypothetical protein